jgi:AraC-like DNA-binding protein
MRKIQQSLRQIHQIGKRTQEFLIHPEQCPALHRHHIGLAGISKTTPQFRFVRPHPKEPQILVALRGRGRVLLRGVWHDCPAGSAYCTPRGQLHAYTGASGWEVGWITYDVSAPIALAEPMLLRVDPRSLEYVLYGLHQEIMTRADPAVLEHWAELLQVQGRRILETRHPARLWQLWQKVQADLAFPWSLASLAAAQGTGAEYLRRLCLQENGTTPMRQVSRLRMQQAISLLSQGYKVEAVAKDVGYENAFAFSTAFKRMIGRSPSHFHAKQ